MSRRQLLKDLKWATDHTAQAWWKSLFADAAAEIRKLAKRPRAVTRRTRVSKEEP